MTESKRWVARPEGSNWGDFGPDDRLGRLNTLDPECVKRAALEIKEGRCFSLSHPLERPAKSINTSRYPAKSFALKRDDKPFFNFELSVYDPNFVDVACDDAAFLNTHYSTHWDALGHVGARFDADGDGVDEIVYYNGWRGDIDVTVPSVENELVGYECYEGSKQQKVGISPLAQHGFQGRGVLVDLFRYYGNEQKTVSFRELKQAMDDQKVTVHKGDILILYTGLCNIVRDLDMESNVDLLRTSCCALDGGDPELLEWIEKSGIVAIASDNYGVESFPYERVYGDKSKKAEKSEVREVMLPLHHHCLFKLGIPLGEIWYLTELASWLRENDRNSFYLSAAPIHLSFTSGAPVNPVAVV